MFVRWFLMVFPLALGANLVAAEWLPAGIHREVMSADGRCQFTAVVPTAAAGGQQVPVVFVLPNRHSFGHRGLLDPKPWQPWAERRGILVVALDQGFTKDLEAYDEPTRGAPAIATYLGEVVEAVGQRVNLHPVLRIAVADGTSTKLACWFAEKQGGALGALLLTRPTGESQSTFSRIPKHTAIFLLAGAISQSNFEMLPRCRSELYEAGLTLVRAAVVKDLDDNKPVPQAVCELAADHVLDLVSTTSPTLTAEQRIANLAPVVERNREWLKANDRDSFDRVGWMFSIPGLEQMRKSTPALSTLTGEWLDLAINLTKADEATKLVEAHEFLSVVAKRSQVQFADREHQRAINDELKRLRKIPAIKAEIAAADLLANAMSALEADYTIAKQRTILKQLEDLVVKHPATHAGKEAAKMLEPLRRNLR